MFNFIEEFSGIDSVIGYKYMNIGGKKFYMQGFKSILSFSQDSVILKVPNGEIEIQGNNLNIEELGVDTILIAGNILRVNLG